MFLSKKFIEIHLHLFIRALIERSRIQSAEVHHVIDQRESQTSTVVDSFHFFHRSNRSSRFEFQRRSA